MFRKEKELTMPNIAFFLHINVLFLKLDVRSIFLPFGPGVTFGFGMHCPLMFTPK